MITQEWLKEHFDYHPDGFLVVKERWCSNAPWWDKKIGWCDKSTGYHIASIYGIQYKLHRLIWVWHNDEWPMQLDHIDRNTNNNKIENLRVVTDSESMLNRGIFKNNTIGVKGIHPFIRRNGYRAFRAQLQVNGKRYRSLHSTLEDAITARNLMEEKYAS